MYKPEAMYLLQGLNFAHRHPPPTGCNPRPACFDQKNADWNENTKSAADSVAPDRKPPLTWAEVMQHLNTTLAPLLAPIHGDSECSCRRHHTCPRQDSFAGIRPTSDTNKSQVMRGFSTARHKNTQKCNLPAGAAHMKFFQEDLATTSAVAIPTTPASGTISPDHQGSAIQSRSDDPKTMPNLQSLRT
jgi:hypothetical protein